MEDILPTNNCPADPEDQEEEEPIQILGQEHIGLPNEDTTMFSLQREPQAQDDVIFEDMDGVDHHQSVGPAP